jgi:hypothetical protein
LPSRRLVCRRRNLCQRCKRPLRPAHTFTRTFTLAELCRELWESGVVHMSSIPHATAMLQIRHTAVRACGVFDCRVRCHAYACRVCHSFKSWCARCVPRATRRATACGLRCAVARVRAASVPSVACRRCETARPCVRAVRRGARSVDRFPSVPPRASPSVVFNFIIRYSFLLTRRATDGRGRERPMGRGARETDGRAQTLTSRPLYIQLAGTGLGRGGTGRHGSGTGAGRETRPDRTRDGRVISVATAR